jgi:hypothetical protein
MPGYWFQHNMYALVRNARKYRARDKRVVKEQNIEFDFLAPDSAEEMIRGMEILGSALEEKMGRSLSSEDMENHEKIDASLDLKLEGMANKRMVRIIHPLRGYLWYRKMLRFYGARELRSAVQQALQRGGGKRRGDAVVKDIKKRYSGPYRRWENIGGQLIPEPELNELMGRVCDKRIDTWEQLHQSYDEFWKVYPEHKIAHALYCLLYTFELSLEDLTAELICRILEESVEVANELLQLAFASRRKDFENPYRRATFGGPEEMEAVLGKLEDISFLKGYTEEIETYRQEVKECLSAFC